VQAALLTGARSGELATLKVQDFDSDTGTIEIRGGKTGARTVYLSNEAIAFFSSITLGQPNALAVKMLRDMEAANAGTYPNPSRSRQTLHDALLAFGNLDIDTQLSRTAQISPVV